MRFDIGEVFGVFSMVVIAAAHASAMAMVDLLGVRDCPAAGGWLAARYAARYLFARAMYCSSAGVSFLRGRAIS